MREADDSGECSSCLNTDGGKKALIQQSNQSAFDHSSAGEDWNSRLRRRRRIRTLVAWLYLSSVTLTVVIHVTRRWDAEQFEWLTEWGSLFLTPALCVWVWQSLRRRYARQDGGELIASFPPQRVGPLPRWLPALAYLVVSTAPFLMLFFRDAHLLMMVAIAFAGVIMFALAWLKYDGIPVECRRHALLIDGVHLVNWVRIVDVETTKRSNMVRLLIKPRRKRIIDGDVSDDLARDPEFVGEFEQQSKNVPLALRGNSDASGTERQSLQIQVRDVFVCAEDRQAFLAFIQACSGLVTAASRDTGPAD